MTDRPRHEREYERLIRLMLDGALTEVESEELDVLLGEHPELRRLYVRDVFDHMLLGWELNIAPAPAPLVLETPPQEVVIVEPASLWSRWSRTWAAAAALLIVGVVVVVYVSVAQTEPNDPNEPSTSPTRPPVATVTWRDGELATAPLWAGQDLTSEPIRMIDGELEMVLRSGVQANAFGASELQVMNPMLVSMARGGAEFTVPRSAKGFTVQLPGGVRVIDKGTRFRVNVDENGQANVAVLDGLVELVDRDGTSVEITRSHSARVEDGLVVGPPVDRSATAVKTIFRDGFDGLDEHAPASSDVLNGEGSAAARVDLTGTWTVHNRARSGILTLRNGRYMILGRGNGFNVTANFTRPGDLANGVVISFEASAGDFVHEMSTITVSESDTELLKLEWNLSENSTKPARGNVDVSHADGVATIVNGVYETPENMRHYELLLREDTFDVWVDIDRDGVKDSGEIIQNIEYLNAPSNGPDRLNFAYIYNGTGRSDRGQMHLDDILVTDQSDESPIEVEPNSSAEVEGD